MKRKKDHEYAGKILSCLNQLFNDEDGENFIGVDELSKGDNGTDFIHALANIVPTTIYNKFTGSDEENLSFNHIANRLCFQFREKEAKKFARKHK